MVGGSIPWAGLISPGPADALQEVLVRHGDGQPMKHHKARGHKKRKKSQARGAVWVVFVTPDLCLLLH